MGGTIILNVLPRPTSDHNPVFLETRSISKGPNLFRFENIWLKVVGFKEIMQIWWSGMQV